MRLLFNSTLSFATFTFQFFLKVLFLPFRQFTFFRECKSAEENAHFWQNVGVWYFLEKLPIFYFHHVRRPRLIVWSFPVMNLEFIICHAQDFTNPWLIFAVILEQNCNHTSNSQIDQMVFYFPNLVFNIFLIAPSINLHWQRREGMKVSQAIWNRYWYAFKNLH